jgi:hypothetical protein
VGTSRLLAMGESPSVKAYTTLSSVSGGVNGKGEM